MNSKQISFVATSRRVSNFLKKYPEVTNGLPTFLATQTEFDSNLAQIEICGNQQKTNLSGLRTQKEDMKVSTGKRVLDVSHRIETYAIITGDVVLSKKVHLAETVYMRSSDHDFMSSSNIVYELAESKKMELTEYGVTPVSVTELKTAIEGYRALVDAPKEGTTERKQVTDQLAILLEVENGVLSKLDALYELIRYTHPAIYAEYHDTRKIVYRSGTLSVKCEVTDAETGLPLNGAAIAFSLNGVLILEKTTSQNGGFTVKSFEDGAYSVSITRLGYVPQTLAVNILDVEMTTIKIAMVKESV